MLINGQKQIVKLSGMIRPYDINPINNSVDSDEIANLKISYSKKGAFTNEIEKPWGSELLEKISPF
jgi:flagellar L-ring protein precursor FlgH